MVTLPEDFVATRYPGYFYNTKNKKLYSMKISGILTPLQHYKGGVFGWRVILPGYRISVRGFRKTMTDQYLSTLVPKVDSVVPTREKRDE